jgi:hypothetical protein
MKLKNGSPPLESCRNFFARRWLKACKRLSAPTEGWQGK